VGCAGNDLGRRLSASGSVTFTDVANAPVQAIGTIDPTGVTPRGSLLSRWPGPFSATELTLYS
jgi:hypothetical protein